MACVIVMLAGCAAAPTAPAPVATTPTPAVAGTDPVVSTTPEATTPVNDNMDDTEDVPVETVYPDDSESTTSEPAIDLNRYATDYAYADGDLRHVTAFQTCRPSVQT